jgi:uncharacterized protein
MLTLKLDDIPEEGLNLNWKDEKASTLAYLESLSRIDFGLETPLEAEAHIRRVDQSILVRGKVETILRLQCVRCLKEFSYPLSSTFDLTLQPLKETSLTEEAELGEEDMELSFFEGGEIRLSEVACEQIFLEVPYQPLCQEGCKGLCPQCGKDLNASSCECVKEDFGSGFAALQKVKINS